MKKPFEKSGNNKATKILQRNIISHFLHALFLPLSSFYCVIFYRYYLPYCHFYNMTIFIAFFALSL